jgi:hypothetical protein
VQGVRWRHSFGSLAPSSSQSRSRLYQLAELVTLAVRQHKGAQNLSLCHSNTTHPHRLNLDPTVLSSPSLSYRPSGVYPSTLDRWVYSVVKERYCTPCKASFYAAAMRATVVLDSFNCSAMLPRDSPAFRSLSTCSRSTTTRGRPPTRP